MPITKNIRVVKVPLSRDERPPDRPQAFPRMPRLYLELFENKAKVKQDLINKEHMPGADNSYPFHAVRRSESSPREDYEGGRPVPRDNEEIAEKFDTNSINSVSSVSSANTPEIRDSDNESAGSISDVSSGSDAESGSSEGSVKSNVTRESDELSVRLKELLADTDDESIEDFANFKKKLDRSDSVSDRSTDSMDKYSRRRDSPMEVQSTRTTPYHRPPPRDHDRDHGGVPPTLKELEQQGHYRMNRELRDVNMNTIDDQETGDKKREILFKFDLLRKSYPNANTSIPEFTIHSELGQMQKEYDSTVRRLSLDSTVENYKQYLIGGFMLTEFVFGNFLGFDMQGFTQQQIISMSSYERLLIELGEKSYVPSGSKWPIELRLLFMIIMNAAFFIVGKMIMAKTGANLMGMINNMNTSNNRASNQGVPAAPTRRRRMRGPNIDLDDIPEAGDEDHHHQTAHSGA